MKPEILKRLEGVRGQLGELCEMFGGAFVVIGGWATHAHNPRELTFDGDAMVSLEADGTLRDMFQVTTNHRMKKKQFVGKDGCDFDIYVEQQHGLRVPFSRVAALAEKRAGLLVACPEHLLILKLEAARDRAGSGKGDKDKQDVLGLMAIGNDRFTHPGELAIGMTENDWAFLGDIAADVAATERYCGGNSWEAKTFRTNLSVTLDELKKASTSCLELSSKKGLVNTQIENKIGGRG